MKGVLAVITTCRSFRKADIDYGKGEGDSTPGEKADDDVAPVWLRCRYDCSGIACARCKAKGLGKGKCG